MRGGRAPKQSKWQGGFPWGMHWSKPDCVVGTDKQEPDKRHPIYLRVYFEGQRTYYSLKLASLKGEWNARQACYKDDVRYQYENQVIEDWKQKASAALDVLRRKEINFTPEVFKGVFDSGGTTGTLLDVFNKRMKQLEEEERVKSRASFRNTYRALKVFLNERYNKKDVEFDKVNYIFLTDFQSWLLSTDRKYSMSGRKPRKFNLNSVSVYMRNIRTIYNVAILRGDARQEDYPFGRGGFKIPKQKVKKRALRMDELNAIAQLTVPPDKLDSKLYYLFMAYGNGINPGDMARLRYSQNVFSDHLKFTRHKTRNTSGIEVVIRLDKVIGAILKHFHCDGRDMVFPVLDEGMSEQQITYRYTRILRKINQDIKEIAKDAGIKNPGEITAYTARHTFAYVDYILNKDIVATSRALGHADIKITQTYLESLGAEEVERSDRKRITDYVGSSLMSVNKAG